MSFVSSALTALDIEFRSCVGSMRQRTQSVQAFKTGNVPILILSSEDSASGLNLTEASHVVIFHPFLIDREKKIMQDGTRCNADTKLSLEQEEQGIARAWRSGQVKQVQVVYGWFKF
jgi:SNF2 family DNA or RNA helicase